MMAPTRARNDVKVAIRRAVLVLILVGCEGGEQPPPCVPVEVPVEFDVGRIVLAVPDEAGVAEGFDLDGRASTDGDSRGCFHADFASPSMPGIMNVDTQLGLGIERWTDVDADAEYAAALARGEIGIQVTTMNDVDGCGLVVLRVDGVESSGRVVGAEEARFSSPLDVPVFLMETRLDLRVRDARIRIDRSSTPPRAIVGGGIGDDDFVAEVASAAPDIDEGLIRMLFEQVSDLEPNAHGVCRRVSASWVLVAAM